MSFPFAPQPHEMIMMQTFVLSLLIGALLSASLLAAGVFLGRLAPSDEARPYGRNARRARRFDFPRR
jgi:hypothetical protein